VSRVVVCAPCWNQVGYTRWFVSSVLRNSEGHDVHLILLDNGSVDETRDYITSLRRKTTTTILNAENVGVNPAWNALLEEAIKPKYAADAICLANNDIVVGPGWLDSVCQAFQDPANASYFVANGAFANQHTFEDDVRQALPALRGQRVTARGGWCLFFTPAMVRLFHPIPPELVLWFGDDWMHYHLEKAGLQCEAMLDCCALHFLSKSVAEYPNKVERIAKDREAFMRLVPEMVPVIERELRK
jgi:GT2 family glycosyltransferase